MLFFRTLGNSLLGSTSLFQLAITCFLACFWGFLPGIYAAPGLVILGCLILLFSAVNLPLFLLLAGVAKLIAMLLTPVCFKFGVILLEGPTNGLFRGLINGSGTALLGLDYYLTTGSLVFGLVFGAVAAWLLVRGVTIIRQQLVHAEENNEAYQQFSQKGWVRFLSWCVLGVKPDQLSHHTKHNPLPFRIRMVAQGLILVALVVFGTPITEKYVIGAFKAGLTQANGATVDTGTVTFDLKQGRLVVEDLAMCDPANLDMDRFQAERLTMDLSVSELFAKRLALDVVLAEGGRLNQPRQSPGTAITRPEREPVKFEGIEGKDLEAYIEKAKEMKERLKKLRQILEDVSGQMPEADEEEFEDWLAREIEAKGYGGVRAVHLVNQAPAFFLGEFKAGKVENGMLDGETIDIEGSNLSSHPKMVEAVPALKVTSTTSDTLIAAMTLGEAAAKPQPSTLNFGFKGYPMEKVNQQLKGSEKYFKDGTVDFALKGEFRAGNGSWIDLPLTVTLRNVTLDLPEVDPVTLNQFPITLRLKGPLDRPGIHFDEKAFMESLRKNGFNAVAEQYKKRLQAEVDEKVDELKDEAEAKIKEELGNQLGDTLGDVLGGSGTNDGSGEKDAGNSLEQGLGGLLGGDKKESDKPDDGTDKAKESPVNLEKELGGLLGNKKKKEEPPSKDNQGNNR